MKNNYDLIAPFYQVISRTIFGGAIANAHRFLTNSVAEGSTVLIVGGGTGEILKYIADLHRTGIDITYVELSKKMIDLASKKDWGANKVRFVNVDIASVNLEQRFDAVITPFLFDNFSASTAAQVFNKIHLLLKPGGLWLYADFEIRKHSPLWQKLLLGIMYKFFRVVANIEARQLPDVDKAFLAKNYEVIRSKRFYGNFIKAEVFKKVYIRY